MYQNFSEKLKDLMMKRKISGQKIADEMNVSQKTISRYATGEIVPNEEVQKKILDFIAQTGGHVEDAKLEWKFSTNSISELKRLLESEKTILTEQLKEWEKEKEDVCKAFSMFEPDNQQFVLDNFEIFNNIEVYEMLMCKSFLSFSDEKQKFILDSLATVHFEVKNFTMKPDVCKKIINYMEMISKCKNIVYEDEEKWSGGQLIQAAYNENCQAYEKKIEEMSGKKIKFFGWYLWDMIKFDEKVWYLLMLVQILALSDTGVNSTFGEGIVGDKVSLLLKYIINL